MSVQGTLLLKKGYDADEICNWLTLIVKTLRRKEFRDVTSFECHDAKEVRV